MQRRTQLLHEPHAAVLVLALHHSIADGVSSVYLIRDIMQGLSGQKLVALPVPEPQDAWLSRIPAPPAPDFGSLKLDAIWGPSGLTGQKGDHSVGVASARRRGICLMYSSFSPYPRLLERMVSLLTAACRESS
jgi:hypothetical protein